MYIGLEFSFEPATHVFTFRSGNKMGLVTNFLDSPFVLFHARPFINRRGVPKLFPLAMHFFLAKFFVWVHVQTVNGDWPRKPKESAVMEIHIRRYASRFPWQAKKLEVISVAGDPRVTRLGLVASVDMAIDVGNATIWLNAQDIRDIVAAYNSQTS